MKQTTKKGVGMGIKPNRDEARDQENADGNSVRSVGTMGTGTVQSSTASASGDDNGGLTDADREAIAESGHATEAVDSDAMRGAAITATPGRKVNR